MKKYILVGWLVISSLVGSAQTEFSTTLEEKMVDLLIRQIEFRNAAAAISWAPNPNSEFTIPSSLEDELDAVLTANASLAVEPNSDEALAIYAEELYNATRYPPTSLGTLIGSLACNPSMTLSQANYNYNYQTNYCLTHYTGSAQITCLSAALNIYAANIASICNN